ncbi:hypothetical protein pb186bvf_017060 [Paramecium bursaria]
MINDFEDYYGNSFQEQKKNKRRELTDQEIIQREKVKLVRNRESAKNSRKRKKIYVELLENKVAGLTQQLQEYQELQQKNQAFLQSFSVKCLQKHDKNQRKLLDLSPECVSDKQEAINFYSQEIYKQAIPVISQYFMKEAQDLKPDQINAFQNSLKQFQECFQQIDQVKSNIVQELESYNQSMVQLYSIDNQGYAKFVSHMRKSETFESIKDQIDDMDEELHQNLKEADLPISVEEVYGLYNKSLQFIKKPKLN